MKDSQPVKTKPRKFKLNKKNKNSTKPSPKKEENTTTKTRTPSPVTPPNPPIPSNSPVTPANPPFIPSRLSVILNKVKDLLVIPIQLHQTIKSKILKYKLNHSQLILIPLITLSLILLIISTLNILLYQKIEKEKPLPLQYTIKISPYPLMDKIKNPDITAQSAIITDADSHTILYSKNPNLRFSMASTTKIMTALVALDYYKDTSILTIYAPSIEGSNIGFYQGEKFYFKDLLYAMLLPSSNEAAYAIAQNYPGGKDAFVQKMNEKAQKLNLTNTHFGDPIGLDDDNNYSTVMDLSNLASYAIKNKELATIFATKQKTITDLTTNNTYQLDNLNKLLGEDGVNGIKTGTTNGAGEVLVTSKEENGHTFIIIVMKSTDRFADTKILLSLITKNVHFYNPQVSF